MSPAREERLCFCRADSLTHRRLNRCLIMLSKRFTSNRKSSGHHYTRDILQSIVDNHLLDLISIQVTALDGVSQAPHVNEFVHIEVDTIELLKVLDLRNRKRRSIHMPELGGSQSPPRTALHSQTRKSGSLIAGDSRSAPSCFRALPEEPRSMHILPTARNMPAGCRWGSWGTPPTVWSAWPHRSWSRCNHSPGTCIRCTPPPPPTSHSTRDKHTGSGEGSGEGSL